MDDDAFWTLIEGNVVRDETGAVEVSGLEETLCARSIDDVAAFDRLFTKFLSRSYSWDLWGAAYLINGGCSDDGFEYFRGWLIAMGRRAYENALTSPDSLVEIAQENSECEDVLHVSSRAFERLTGGGEFQREPQSYPELGEGWDFDDEEEMKRRYPKLAARFNGAE